MVFSLLALPTIDDIDCPSLVDELGSSGITTDPTYQIVINTGATMEQKEPSTGKMDKQGSYRTYGLKSDSAKAKINWSFGSILGFVVLLHGFNQ